MPSKFRSVIDLKLVLMCIFKRAECWNVAYSKRNIVSYDLSLSGKFRISCISRSDISILAAKWSFRLWTNQFLIISKLFLLSAEFFVSFSWNDWAIIFLTCIFFFKNIMWQFFLNIFDGVWYIMKCRINQSFISAQTYLAWWSRWCVEEKS